MKRDSGRGMQEMKRLNQAYGSPLLFETMQRGHFCLIGHDVVRVVLEDGSGNDGAMFS